MGQLHVPRQGAIGLLLGVLLSAGCGGSTEGESTQEGNVNGPNQAQPSGGAQDPTGKTGDQEGKGTGTAQGSPDAGVAPLKVDAGAGAPSLDASAIPADAHSQDAGAQQPGQTDLGSKVEVIDFGSVPLQGGKTKTFEVNVPDGTLSLVVVVEGYSGVMYTVEDLKNPDGVVLASGMEMKKHINRVMPSEGSGSFMVPNSPDLYKYWVPGKYTFAYKGDKSSGFTSSPDTRPIKVKALLKKGTSMTAVPDAGSMDLNVYCTGSADITASSAPTNARMKFLLDGWKKMYEQVHIKINQVRYYDIDSKFKSIESIQGENNDLGQVCRLSAGKPVGVNLVLVDDISMGGMLGGLGAILGISGGIPAPVTVNGLERSCEAIATKIPDQISGDVVDLTSAHETGHFLGLFHSSESFLGALAGAKHDPISDTPEENPDNIMFNNPVQGKLRILTAMQGTVMRSSPLVY